MVAMLWEMGIPTARLLASHVAPIGLSPPAWEKHRRSDNNNVARTPQSFPAWQADKHK